MKEQIIGFIFEGIKKTVAKLIRDYNIKRIIRKNVKFLVDNEANKDYSNSDLSIAFNDEEVTEIANELKNTRGYDFVNLLKERLKKVLEKYDLSSEEYSYFISSFIDSFLFYIKENRPDLFEEYYLNEIYSLNNKTYVSVKQVLEEVIKIRELVDNNKLNIKTIYDIDEELKKTLKNELDLSFFASDDNNFIFEFEKKITSNQLIINVVSKSIYETRLIVLNELKKFNKKVLIVQDINSWEKLISDVNIKGYVLIPYFIENSKAVPAIKDNINVFIFSEDFICNSRDKIQIRKRMKKTIENNLKKYGFESDEAYSLVKDTNGFFGPLMNKLYIGKYPAYYDCSDDEDVISVALLIGEWTESIGDKELIEYLSGIQYSEFIKIIDKYLHGDNPLFVRYQEYNNVHYLLTSKEDAWNQLINSVNNDLWNKFINIIPSIFEEIDPKFNISITYSTEKMLCNESSKWSKIMKNSILMTLIFIRCYFGHNDKIRDINTFVNKVLNFVDTKEKWADLSYYIDQLIEISPDIVLDKFESEIKNNTGLIDLFKLNEGGIFGTNPYCKYLCAIEQLLLQDEYVDRAIRLLFELDNYDIKYSISNSPKEVLNKVFCPWINVSVINSKRKGELAEKFIIIYKKAINIILDNMPGYNSSMVGYLCSPKYRNVGEISDVTKGEYYSLCEKYVKLCLSKAYFNNEYAEKVISALVKYKNDKEFIVTGLDEIIIQYSNLDDYRKEKLKTYLRDKIYHHRYFNTAEWAVNEDIVIELEKAMNKISFNNKVFEYKYLFIPSYNFPLLKPVPHEKDNFSERKSKNDELREKEIELKIVEFKENNYELEELIRICDINDSTLGYYVFKYFCNGSYNEEIFKLLLDNYKNDYVIIQYARMVYMNNVKEYKELIDFSIRNNIDNYVLVSILGLCDIDNDTVEVFINLDENIKYKLWEQGVSVGNDKDTIPLLINECITYGNIKSYINLIYDIKEKISVDQVFDYMLKFLTGNIRKNNITNFDEYHIKELFKFLRNYVANDKVRKEQMASLELLFYKVLDWSNAYFLKEEMKTNPKTYAQLIWYVFKSKTKEHTEEEKSIGGKLWSLYSMAKFCPTEKNGTINENELREWIAKFNEYLIEQGQDNLLSNILGHLFANSPMEKDGVPLLYSIRNYIEDNFDNSLLNSFCVEEMNKRGVYTSSGGEQEHQLSIKYKKYANLLRKDYPNCARIYDNISDDYRNESLREREREENG